MAVERVHAAVEAARKLPIPFVLTARAEQLIHGSTDLDATIRRLQAFEQAGADVLYAPGLRDLETIRTVVASVSKPVNVVMTHADPSIDRGSAGRSWRQAHQHRRQRLAFRAQCVHGRRPRNGGARHFHLRRRNPPWSELLEGFAKGRG